MTTIELNRARFQVKITIQRFNPFVVLAKIEKIF
jgi:hypothetical protein